MKKSIAVSLFVVSVLFAQSLASSIWGQEPQEAAAIASQEIDGIEARVRMVQIQRLGGEIALSKDLEIARVDDATLRRCLILTVEASGEVEGWGPLRITLANGDILDPVMVGSRLSSGYASIVSDPNDFSNDFAFSLSEEIQFKDVFPIRVSFSAKTNEGETIRFVFEEITP